ncbi:MAG: DUF4397 domain-containing protein [Bdellovibrionales bacterium]|nr:DUF4397 domain-containing protein [Bdellovibrionales bacterium]
MKVCHLSLLVIFSFLVSCGGGGGAGGSSEANGNFGSGNVRFIHGSLASPPVTLATADGVIIFPEAEFLGVPTRAEISPGSAQFTVSDRVGRVSLRRGNLVSEAGLTTLFFYGDSQVGGVNMVALQGGVPDLAQSEAAFRVVHGVVQAASLEIAVPGIAPPDAVPFGGSSSYFVVPAGETRISVSRESDGRGVQTVAPVLESGESYTIVFAGEIGIFVSARTYQD